MGTSHTIARLSRWGLIAATVLMGIALLATVWSTYDGVNDASRTVVRGTADTFHDSIRAELHAGSKLAETFETLAPEGLRYLALVDARGRVIEEAGTPVAPVAASAPGLVQIDELVRASFRPRPRRGGEADRGSLQFIFDFEPRTADELLRTARRTLAIGSIAAGGFLLIGLALVRWLLRREAGERRRELERRLASLGQMSAVLAHEIRNPLASLKGHAQLLERSLPEGERNRAKASRVVDEAVRLETLTNDLLEFARHGEVRRSEVDPAALLREAAGEHPLELDVAGAPAAWPLDAELMRRVLANLVDNAVQAGTPVVATARQDGRRLELTVRDHGEGIPEADLPRIFEPFFTRRTKGTGLGLAVVRRIVELHGGTVTAGNHAGGGAIFRVTIPR
jgi:two-component system, NtrC family, sensor histidine kinase HydH